MVTNEQIEHFVLLCERLHEGLKTDNPPLDDKQRHILRSSLFLLLSDLEMQKETKGLKS